MIWAVIASAGIETLGDSIGRHYPGSYHFPPGCWFVDADLTAEALADKLGIKGGKLAGVQASSSHYGWGNAKYAIGGR